MAYNEAPAYSFSPNLTINLFDDFIGALNFNLTGTGNEMISILPWSSSTFVFQAKSAIDNAHPGLVGNLVITATGHSGLFAAAFGNGGTELPLMLGGGSIKYTWIVNVVNISNSTNRYVLQTGLGDTENSTTVANGVYFKYSDNINSGNWSVMCSSASTATTINTSIPVTTGWHNLSCTINAAGTSVIFSIDGVAQTAMVTNIPTTGLSQFLDVIWQVGTVAANSIYADLFSFTQTLTAAR